MADWVTISALATAGGTLVLAGTTRRTSGGGQRVISRFRVTRDGETWTLSVVRHWQIDRSNPR